MQNVRSEQGLAYSVFGNYGSSTLYPGQFYAGLFTRSEATAEAIKAVRREMEKLQEEPVSDQELKDTKDSIFNSLVFRNASLSSVLNQRMTNEYYGRPADSFERYIEELRQVTAADIQRVAQEYMRPEQMKILVVGNSNELGDQLQEFGEVQEIDITIRESLETEEVIAGDAAEGSKWLTQMASAILPNGGLEGSVTMDADNNVQTPQGQMTIGLTQTIDFENESINANVNAPMGLITMTIEDGQGSMQMGGNTMPMQPAQKDQMLAELYRSPIYLALNQDQLDVEFMGMEEMEGDMYAVVRINDDTTLNLYLDPETSLPMYTTYRTFNPQMGGTVTVQLNSTDWRESDGVMMPYKMVSFSDGQQVSSTTLKSHGIE